MTSYSGGGGSDDLRDSTRDRPPPASSSSVHSHSYSISHSTYSSHAPHHSLSGSAGGVPSGSTTTMEGSTTLAGSSMTGGGGYSISTPREALSSLPPSLQGHTTPLERGTRGSGDGTSIGLGLGLSPGAQRQGAGGASASAATQALVASIFQRIYKRLPCNSGWRLSSLEEEELLRSCVSNLIGLSKFQLGAVVKELLATLENLHKQTISPLQDDKVAIDVMQSQLFMLQVLAACMLHQWRNHSLSFGADTGSPGSTNGGRGGSHPGSRRGSATNALGDTIGSFTDLPRGWPDPPPLDDSQAKQALSIMTSYLRTSVAREEALLAGDAPEPGRPGTNGGVQGMGSGAGTGAFGGRSIPSERSLRDFDGRAAGGKSKAFSSSRGWTDDAGAAGAGRDQGEDSERSESAHMASLALVNGPGLFTLYPAFPPACYDATAFLGRQDAAPARPRPPGASDAWSLRTDSSEASRSRASLSGLLERVDGAEGGAALTRGIYKHVGLIVFYLSSSNWPVVYARFRNRLAYLSTTAEENPNSVELRLLECSNLQRLRLGSVVQELCTSFVHLKRSAQSTVALVLRRAIWSFLQYHPAEVAHLFSLGRRLEGGPDVLFDHAFSLAESTRKKAAFWPMLTALLIICPDVVSKAAIGDGRKSGSMAKKINFLDTLRKSLRTSKLGDVAALCYVDICAAAAATARSESGLRLLVPDIDSDLREKLFDAQRPMLNASKQLEVPLMVDALVAFFRLDPKSTISDLVPVLMADNSPPGFLLVLVKATIQLASEVGRITWQPDVALLYPRISTHLRLKWKELCYRLYLSENVPPGGRTDLRRAPTSLRAATGPNGSVANDAGARLALLHAIMDLWAIDITSLLPGLDYSHSTSLKSLSGSSASLMDQDRNMKSALQVDSVLSLVYFLQRAVLLPESSGMHDKALDLLRICGTAPGPDQRRPDSLDFFRQSEEAWSSSMFDFEVRAADRLASTDSPASQRVWLLLLSRTIKEQARIGQQQAADGSYAVAESFHPSQEQFEASSDMIETALLLTICSSDTDLCALAMRTCGIYARVRRSANRYVEDPRERLRLFEDLADPSFVLTGRIAQQKRIRALLRGIKEPFHAALVAWKEAYRRWSTLTQIVARPLAEEASDAAQEKAAQWHNYAGFLAAFGGACMIEDPDKLYRPSLQLLKRTDADPPIQIVESFMQEMVDLLVSDSIWVREKVKETLGLDLSARLNGILVRQVHAVLSDFFDKATGLPRPAEMFTIFVEQSISVALMVLARMTEPSEATLAVDIGSLMVLYVEYVNSLGKREQAVRIKTAMCQLCSAFMNKKAFFAFTNELRVRNRLFQALVTWTTDSTDETQASGKLDKLQRELDVVCLQTISVLLDRLPLLLADDALLLDDKVEWAKSRQFSLYSSHFIKVLNRARSLEEAAEWRAKAATAIGQIEAKHAPSLAKTPTVKAKEQQAIRELAPLKESAILALSNLLASNIDSGLQHSLQLAYHDDPQLRTAFMQIMCNVLNQGTAFDDLERLSAVQGQSKLVELITEGDMHLALAICNVCRGYDQEALDTILLSIFDSHGGIIRFLKAALGEEIERTPSEEMVFRSNSFRTHLLSVFGRTHGYEYLRSIMAPLITEMANKPRGYSFEIDPSKLEPGESAIVNQHRLEEMAQAFIDQICSSAHRVPAVLRELCRHIRTLMDRKFPNSRYQGVGGFMFLRFISPAIVAPQIIDINLTGPGKELRRGLLLISKILQTLASNNLFPPHKEPFMTSLNDFLKRNVWRVTTFLDQVSDARTDPDRLLAADQPLGYGIQPSGYGIDAIEQKTLHRVLYENVDKIGKDLLTRSDAIATSSPVASVGGGSKSNGDGASSSDPRRVYESLCNILADMGDPRADEPQATVLGSHGSLDGKQAFQEFLRRNSGRNIDEALYRGVFKEGPASKMGRPVFYFSPQNLDAQTTDFEGLILFILQALESCLNSEFEFVIDCTSVQANNLAPVQWVTYFTSMLPPEISANLRNIIVFNINTVCKTYARPWLEMSMPRDGSFAGAASPGKGPASGAAGGNGVGAGSFATAASASLANINIAYCNSLSELESYIERRNIALEPTTIQIVSSVPERRFTQVTMVWYYRALIPVQFRIGGEHLQMTALKEQEILPGRKAFTNDVFHLADIDDVRAISIRGDDNTFFVTCRGGTVSFLFNSRDRGDIVQTLRQAKAKVQRFLPAKAVDRVIRPSDVPGTLLNMAMLNALSSDHALRVSAYNLLCALSTSFNFGASSARKRLLSAKGLALPANMMLFVQELSRDFAVAAPGVTLEFLASFFEGFERTETSHKTMCLAYMAPWLPNLAIFTRTSRDQQGEYQKRIKEILVHLISITVKQPDMYAAMQKGVWSQIAKLDDLIPSFVEVFAEAAMDSGLHTPRFEAVLDTMVSFASINLRGKLLARLRRIIAKTAQTPAVPQLHENPAWKEIATLVRMNMVLSFTSRIEALLYLPELLHIILLLAGNGSDATRHSIHGTAINLMHSLCTEDPRDTRREVESSRPANPEGLDRLRQLLAQFSEDSCLALFGLPAGNVSPFAASLDIVRESPNNAAIEKLAFLMYQIAEMAAPSTDAANSWRARLTSLVTSTAFQYNPIIQSRAFVLLGCLADLTGQMMAAHPDSASSEVQLAFEVDDDLLYQILVSLRGSITEWATAGNDAPIISIVACLSKVVKILPDRSRYLPQMFWLGIAMIQFGHIPLFKAGVDLLHATVSSIRDRSLTQEHGTDLVQFLLEGRYEFREAACRLDDETGVDFEVNFSFGMAALLVKGLRHPSTKEPTIELLQTMLQLCAVDAQGTLRSADGRVSTTQLGFFVALLPSATRGDVFADLLRMAGCPEVVCQAASETRRGGGGGLHASGPGLFQYLEVMEHKIALLVVTLIASLLQHAESDAEKLLLYGCLADSAREVPAIVSILYGSLAPGMREVFVNSQIGPILDAVQTITQIAVSEPVFAAQAEETALRGGPGAYLDETGYASLLDCGEFAPLQDSRRLVLAKLSTSLLAGLIEAGTA